MVTTVYVALVGLIGLAVLALMAPAAVNEVRLGVVRRRGVRTSARCVAVLPPRTRKGRTRHVLEFTGPAGEQVTRGDLRVPPATLVGDGLTLAHRPERPDVVAVVPPGLGLRTALRAARTGLLYLLVVLLVVAGAMAFGIELVRTAVSGDIDPDTLP
ncbi:DUF3592 domain-containing protein [Kitasatospora arboriphila]|uniref:DUF3592 domain-containing protein n=1 Tax=Kitasatospora arboriphila TaxID=258052 RepID=A0ABP4EA44_9ACTN